MGGEDDQVGALNPRKAFWRSSSWSSSRTSAAGNSKESQSEERNPASNGPLRPGPPLTPRSLSAKARSALPPLQPLTIARRSLDEWPNPSSDDLGEWPQPTTPSVPRPGDSHKPGSEGLKIDLSSIGSKIRKDQIAFFDKECSKVADHIYLGGDSVAKNREILRKNGITHVLNCVGFVCPEYFKSDLVYKTLWLQDSPSEDITSILYDVFDYFEDVREEGGRVLVHCCQGVSRSTSLVIAYLMWREGQSFDDAFGLVKSARGIANPNMGFACQLLQCQKRVLAIPLSPNSVLRMYRMAPHSPYDPLHLVPKLLNDPSPAALDSRGAFIIHVLSSIYIWIGRNCDLVMQKDAKAAAFQLVRYERVQGPVRTVEEGEEPLEFWEAFLSATANSDSATKINKEHVESAAKTGAGKRKVDSYDRDFELFLKAIAGGVVPPFSSSVPGQETRLPARESSWSVLRRKFVARTLYRVYSDSALMRDKDSHVHRGQRLTAEATISPPFLSPSSLSSDSGSSSKSCSDSPSVSPSNVSSPLLVPTPTSSNSPAPFLPTSRSPLQQSSSIEPLNSRPGAVCSPSKGPTGSIAERRGSFSLLKLSTLSKDSSMLSRKVPDASSSPCESVQEAVCRSSDCQFLNGEGLGSESTAELLSAEGRLTELSNIKSETLNPLQLLVYRWPSMEKLVKFTREDLDSKSVFLFVTPDTARSGEAGRMLYVWIGSGFKHSNIETESKSCEDVIEVDAVDWRRVGCEFLHLAGLPKDLPIKVFKEQETESLLKLLNTA
ncbi:protein-tyrosine-phosphatase MKP1 [Ananas comosus]|uniref:Protein-tyrosine-phosphatase MKP1 n=1 Tax=Ananas comosus TaxID=4615 RepID=A0A6P5GRR1_ANACO|nr:protein-tyrosine-phosphatase MKP1 [Ananas comosus]XP_020108167.1 protein-tyrosine-phosphatase MKP1 [Ananas comosus]